MGAPVRIKRVSCRSDLEHAFSIRLRVFVREQGVPADIELDAYDNQACHFLALEGDKPVGTARLVVRGRSAKIGRMAVLKRFRRKGIGKKLLGCAVTAARRFGAPKVYLHAQVPAIGFYEAMGFRASGPVFDEAGIPHRKMVLAPKKTVK